MHTYKLEHKHVSRCTKQSSKQSSKFKASALTIGVKHTQKKHKHKQTQMSSRLQGELVKHRLYCRQRAPKRLPIPPWLTVLDRRATCARLAVSAVHSTRSHWLDIDSCPRSSLTGTESWFHEKSREPRKHMPAMFGLFITPSSVTRMRMRAT